MSGFRVPAAACSKYPTSLDEKIKAVRIIKITSKKLLKSENLNELQEYSFYTCL